ncbi:putative ubiquitin-like-specific protease 2B [Camellia lanceoleosa]|uniref:Ubiquitin-like-specific protease 2B n=1 Tax=Camellia lanceoleosa TaxID=1840588 RepID=A0ACC0I0R0_9ERIC|nr:putative ubiquitin-like-specific protease 2B [Camellia lanceoleosa]
MKVQSRTRSRITYSRTRKKRTPKGKTDSVDISSDHSAEVCGDQIVKLHSCQPHIAVHPQENQMGKSVEEAEDKRSEELVLPYLQGGFPRRRRSKRGVNHKNVSKVQNADFDRSQITKDIASQPQFAARRPARKKRKPNKKDEVTSGPEVVYRSSGRERSKRRVDCEKGITPQQGKLDTNTFECYLESLWRSFGNEKRNLFTYLDCLWFSLYTKESSKANVLNWIKKKHIFSKKYVFVPIVRWCHWSLLIFCHFGESLESKSRTPCMLLLDSLQMANPKRLEPGIRKFVLDIYKSEERPENKQQINRIPLKVPKVPQQRNGEECGNFVLYYINLFIESAPENFSINEGYPYFMKEDWFTPEGLECFCKKLDSFCE